MYIDTIFNNWMVIIENVPLTLISKFVSTVLDPVVIAISSLVIFLFIYFKKSKTSSIIFASGIFFTSILTFILKNIVGRIRPINSIIIESGFSFPSGHSLLGIVFFVSLAFILSSSKNRKMNCILAGFFSLFIGFTRLALRVHWLSDVVFGLIIGSLILALEYLIYKKTTLKKS